MKQLTTFYLVRHGQTEWNKLGIGQGHTDIPLNDTGEQEAKDLAEKLLHVHFDEVISSDLLRAKRTAEIIAQEKKLVIKTTAALREKFAGKLEGKPWKDVEPLYKDWKNLTDQQRWQYTVHPSEETNEQAVTRLLTFLREIAVANEGKTILIVSHGGIIRMFLIKLGLGNFEEIGGLENCGYVKVESDGVDFFVKETNGLVSWKDKHGNK